MVSSFRLSEKEERLLENLSKTTGKSRSEIVRLAIQMYHENQVEESSRSSYDRLVAAGFQPLSSGIGDLSHNKAKQRKIILERLKKNHR